MAGKQRDLLEVLELELEFLKGGGYRKFSSWRPQLIFEDSPTCLHFRRQQDSKPCSECALMQLVPPEVRQGRVPCRHIPLNEKNETIHLLNQYGTAEELEATVCEWLRKVIRKLEVERTSTGDGLYRKSA